MLREGMTQEQIAGRLESFARRLSMIATSTTRAHNFEKEMLVKDIKSLAEMLRYTESPAQGKEQEAHDDNR